MDQFKRFSAESSVKTKKASEMVNSLIHTWISVHEFFNNDEFRDMAENFNIEMRTTTEYRIVCIVFVVIAYINWYLVKILTFLMY